MNNIQRQANRLLFKDDTSSSLPVNLRAVIHATRRTGVYFLHRLLFAAFFVMMYFCGV